MIITTNDIDMLYSKCDIENSLECCVCKKTFKTKNRLISHITKKNCYSYQDVFADTEIESYVYTNIFKVFYKAKNGICSINKFRTSKFYKTIIDLCMFCRRNRVDINEYINFGIDNYYLGGNPFILFYRLNKESTLKEFYKKRIPQSETFIDSNKERLHKDKNFLIRSLERGDITIDKVINVLGINNIINDLTENQEYRLMEILKNKSGIKNV